MRLTLRTLLAYMDDILDPADKEELAKKIESSGFAEDLIYRTQDTMRRLRLSAPQVIGTGVALDPNSVSEYLDNVLPPDSVGDFERICLESDVHLAEVASCHHVLTMVLGEPADVDPAMREQMYAIPSEIGQRRHLRIETAHGATGAVAGQTAVAAGGSPAATEAPTAAAAELPEYLRTSMWSRHRLALGTVGVVLLVALTAAVAVGLNDWLRGGASPLAAPPTIAESSPAEPSRVSPPAPGETLVEGEQPQMPGGQAGEAPMNGSLATSAAETGPTAPPTAVESGETAAAGSVAPAETTGGVEPPAGASSLAAADVGAARGGVAAAPSAPATPQAALPVAPAGEAGPAAGAQPGSSEPLIASSERPHRNPLSAAQGASGGGASPTAGQTAGPGGAGTDHAAAPIADLGTYLGGKVVLLHYNEQAGAWFRLPARSSVTNGERLLALPAFRPKITLASGVHVDLSGGTEIVVRTAEAAEANGLPGANTGTPALEVTYGRIVLINTANEDNQVVLKLGPTVADARLARGATLAVEVERSYVPGRDPRTSPAPVVARLYASQGEVVWRVGDSETTIREPARWTIAEGVVSPITADLKPPEWIDQEPVAQRSEQLYGAPVIEESLGYDQPADDQLLELFQAARRREVKSLAARSSIHVGLFTPFIEALRDSDQRPNWHTHIETLRAAMALSPQSANKVWQTLVEQRGEKATADLYEMLCGYNRDQIGHTAEQIEHGALDRLIGWLEDDNLDYRVLAAHDLREITGKNLLSNPAGSLSERALGVRRWRERLKSGELVPLTDTQR
jgi:hypothetical protein